MSKKYFKKGSPVVRGKASVVQWDLETRFYCKVQMKKIIRLLLKEEIDYNVEIDFKEGDSTTLTVYIVNIYDGCWANNLKTISKLLEKVDYNAYD